MILNKYGGVFMMVFISILWIDAEVFAELCTNWTLAGGFVTHEGLVQVYYNGTWVNICADSFDKTDQYDFCDKFGGDYLDPVQQMYDSNVFGAAERNTSISYKRCINSDASFIYEHTCKVASLCCYAHTSVQCSFNTWMQTCQLETGRYIRSKKKMLTYDELSTHNFTNITRKKSWTKSALQEDGCVKNISLAEDDEDRKATNCSNTCRVTPYTSFILFNDDNRTCCLETKSNQTIATDDCSIKNLSVVDFDNKPARFCLAAEVINGTAYVSIEECVIVLQAFTVSQEQLRTPSPTPTSRRTTERHQDGKEKTETTETVSPTTKASDTSGSLDTANTAIVICASLLVLMFIIFIAAILLKFRYGNRKAEKQRSNSVANRTYTLEGFPHRHDSQDEEYTLISDMEVEHSVTESYRPPVPDRGDSKSSNKKEESGGEIITLGEYSTPSDQVRLGYNSSHTTDYCMSTYDDPMRHKLKDETENNGNNESKEERDREKEEGNGRDSMKSSDSQIATGRIDINESDNRSQTPQKQVMETFDMPNANQKQKMLEDEHFENFDLPATKPAGDTSAFISKEDDNNISKNESDDSDYEDTDIIDGNFPTTCSSKRIFEEHVCLDCLKPEHLTKLGIKLISDEVYEKHNNLHKSVSEPFDKSCYYNIGSDGGQRVKETKTDPKRYEGQNHDTLSELQVLRKKKHTGGTRRCSVCNTVYDRLGITYQNDWENRTDNVYDQFGDFKHFKHRQQLTGKRMNST